MSDATDRRRSRLRAYVISPLPLAVAGLLTGTAHANTATDKLNVVADSGDHTSVSSNFSDQRLILPVGGRGYSAKPMSKALANVVPVCTIVGDSFTTQAQLALSGNVRDNDGPVGLSALAVSVTQGSHGTVSMDFTTGSLNGAFTYTPDPGFSGNDSFTYSVESSPPKCHMNSSPMATVTIMVNPVATMDVVSTYVGTNASGNVLSNDLGSNLAVIGFTQPTHGQSNVVSNGTFIYIPQPGFTGTDSFQYTLQDAAGRQSTGTVTLQVAAAAAAATTPTPATSTGALGLLGVLLAWFGLRRRREN
ncbi:MAG: Ig-like domain-containing protein [Rudaea sp.]